MANYFNTLPLREKLNQLGVCEFMDISAFGDGVQALIGKKIVIVGCGAQGLNQGLNLRDSGLDVSYALRQEDEPGKRRILGRAVKDFAGITKARDGDGAGSVGPGPPALGARRNRPQQNHQV